MTRLRKVPRDQMCAEIVRVGLAYDPATGVFTWRDARCKVTVGAVAGTLTRSYWMIHLCGEDYHAHRLAWLYVHGEWPNGEVDHINGNRLDNRIANLRPATRSQNSANMGIPSHNTSGFKGVSYVTRTGQWMAYIRVSGKRHYLGMHATAQDAADAYDRAAVASFGEFARTNAVLARVA